MKLTNTGDAGIKYRVDNKADEKLPPVWKTLKPGESADLPKEQAFGYIKRYPFLVPGKAKVETPENGNGNGTEGKDEKKKKKK